MAKSKKEEPLSITDPKWTDYVLSQLREGEYVYDEENNIVPKCVGLLRFCQEEYGDILALLTDPVKTPSAGCHRSTIKSTVKCKRYSDGEVVEFDGIADTDADSMSEDSPFLYHLSPTSESKAQGRAVKKLLFLNCYTQEELIGSGKKMSKTVRKEEVGVKAQTINVMIERFKICPEKFASELEIKDLSNITLNEATKALDKLNEIELSKEVPKELLK